MRKLMLVASCVLALGACKSKNKQEQFVSDLEGFRDKMCACKDKDETAARKACGEEVVTDYMNWQRGLTDDGNEERPPQELRDREHKANHEFSECADAASGRSKRGK